MVLMEVTLHVLEVQVLEATQHQLIAVLHHVMLIQMLQKMLNVAIKRRVLKLPMVRVVVTLCVVPGPLSSRTKLQLIVVPLLVLQMLIPLKTMHAVIRVLLSPMVRATLVVPPLPVVVLL
tara:strand:- start:113 stop:472 length:360 start_codon:yes stop_codon:yes gene_type:complete